MCNTIYSVMKKISILIILFININFSVLADMNIINSGNILIQKVYSDNTKTLVIDIAKKLYVCSVDGKASKCILSKLVNNRNYN